MRQSRKYHGYSTLTAVVANFVGNDIGNPVTIESLLERAAMPQNEANYDRAADMLTELGYCGTDRYRRGVNGREELWAQA